MKRREPWRVYAWRVAIVVAVVVVLVGLCALVTAFNERRTEEREECLDRGGVVRENDLGWYRGCWYRDGGPVVVVPGD